MIVKFWRIKMKLGEIRNKLLYFHSKKPDKNSVTRNAFIYEVLKKKKKIQLQTLKSLIKLENILNPKEN